MLSPLTLTPDDKIDLLCRLDEFHFWHALDDVRICQRCHRQITGRQIKIVELPGARGVLRLQCPTPDCESSPGEWIYADPVLAARLHNSYRPPPRGLASEAHREFFQRIGFNPTCENGPRPIAEKTARRHHAAIETPLSPPLAMNNEKPPAPRFSRQSPQPTVAASTNRQTRARRNLRVLAQNLKQTLLSQENRIPPAPDPLAP